jgi:hypothetical protein
MRLMDAPVPSTSVTSVMGALVSPLTVNMTEPSNCLVVMEKILMSWALLGLYRKANHWLAPVLLNLATKAVSLVVVGLV